MLAVDVSIAPDWHARVRKLAETPRLIQNAVIGALNDTVDDLVTRNQMEMRQVFDRPTSYVIKGLKRRKAGRQIAGGVKGDKYSGAQAGIYADFMGLGQGTPVETILLPNVYGGPRKPKPFEQRLRAFGILPSGSFAIPGAKMPRNQHGNVTPGRLVQLLNEIGALQDVARASNKRMTSAQRRFKRGHQFYVMRDQSGRATGIAEKRGKQSIVALVFTRQPQYARRYDFDGISQRQAMHSLPRHFNRIIARYMDRRGI
jgi:hypothetical protein